MSTRTEFRHHRSIELILAYPLSPKITIFSVFFCIDDDILFFCSVMMKGTVSATPAWIKVFWLVSHAMVKTTVEFRSSLCRSGSPSDGETLVCRRVPHDPLDDDKTRPCWQSVSVARPCCNLWIMDSSLHLLPSRY
jgi:hypothetical protein